MKITIRPGRLLLAALSCALLLLFLLPSAAFAHATLVRSDPEKDAILSKPPTSVRLWFTEDLNPLLSKAVVLNGNSQRVDNADARIAPNDARELTLSLRPDLPPGTYLVLYQTGSSEDGHTLRGSYLFSISNPDGTLPPAQTITASKTDFLGSGYVSTGNGQLDAPTVILTIAITLIELGSTLWVGAYLWYALVALRAGPALSPSGSQLLARFERVFSLPVLLIVLLANIFILVNQALSAASGSWLNAFSPALLWSLAIGSRFGIFVFVREALLLLAIALALFQLLKHPLSASLAKIFPLINLALGLALLFAMSMSSHAASVSNNTILAIASDLFHLLGSALWIGGILFIGLVYLVELKPFSLRERAHSLVTVLPYYSPLAYTGVALLLLSGPLNSTFHLSSPEQLLSTAYGRTLLVKILLVLGMLLLSAIHVFSLRPRLGKELQKFLYASSRLQALTTPVSHASSVGDVLSHPKTPGKTEKLLAQQVQLREQRLASRTRGLLGVLRWEPLFGVAIILCVGLLNAFAGSLAQPITSEASTQSRPFNAVVKTADSRYNLNINITPNRFGVNTFTVRVTDTGTNKVTTDVGVSLYPTMLDMDMGTDSFNLQPNGKGSFSLDETLSMSGHWQLRIVVRSPDNKLHSATVQFKNTI